MYEQLEKLISKDTEILYNEPMKMHTTFQIGGNADVFISPVKIEDIKVIGKFAIDKKIPVLIIGNGSNLLVSDEGFKGIVIKTRECFNELEINETNIICGAGLNLTKVAHIAQENSLSGMEWAYGIPGTVGGAVFMNAGAYGGEMKDIIDVVWYIDESGNEIEIKKEELEFGYRTSIFNKERINGIISKCRLSLNKGNKDEIINKMNDCLNKRKEKQPLEFPSAGSTFKRPEGHFVGQMLEELGLRGFAVGDAQISEKHAGFIVNKGNATAEDVKKLIEIIKDKVEEKYNVFLETEVKMI